MAKTFPKYGGEFKLAKDAKAAGITREEFMRARTLAYSRPAAVQHWRPSELAASLADVSMAADEVWGKEEAPKRA